MIPNDAIVLVTGGAGFIGSRLVERLAELARVRVFDDFSTGSIENLLAVRDLSHVEIVEGDVSDCAECIDACEGVHTIFHLAVSCLRTSLNDPGMSQLVNGQGTLNVCLGAIEQGAERMVYVSSSEVYGTAATAPMDESHPLEPLTVYGASKLAGEYYVKACARTYNLSATIVRPFNTYGPREPYQGRRAEVIPRFILQLMQSRSPLIFGDGLQTRDFTFVDDTVEGILLAGRSDERGGEAFNIASGCEASILQVCNELKDIMGVDAAAEFADPRPGDVIRHHADIAKARTRLGYSPRTDLRQGLAATVEWLQREATKEVLAEIGHASGEPNW